MAVLLRKSGRVVTSSVSRERYIRNPEYLNLPTLVNGDEKIYLLTKIYEHSNYFRLYATGNYQIDWGDGQGIQTYTSGTYADYEIDWNNISSSTVTTYGFRQAIITVEPQAGASLNLFQCYGGSKHPNDPNVNYNPQIVDVKMAGQNFTNLGSAFADSVGLEQFEFVGTAPNLTNVSWMFGRCYNFKKVVSLDTSNVTNFSQMHYFCNRLIELPKYDLTNATNIGGMFNYCHSIEYLQPWDLDNEAPNITSLSTTFRECQSLTNLPITSCSNITNFNTAFYKNKFTEFNLAVPNASIVSTMFQDCTELVRVTSQFPSGLTNTGSMFDGCNSLRDVKVFDASLSTNTSFMFRSCYELEDLSEWDFRSTTNMSYMFINCIKLKKLPNNLGGGNMSYLIQSCKNIKSFSNVTFHGNPTNLFRFMNSCNNTEDLPNFADTSAVTDIRSFLTNNYQISSLPAWNLSGVTNSDTATFTSCYSLRESNVYGLTKSHAYNNCQLDRDAIVNIFNNLGTAVSQTIYVNNNPGSANLTAEDIAIATGKGWTVVN